MSERKVLNVCIVIPHTDIRSRSASVFRNIIRPSSIHRRFLVLNMQRIIPLKSVWWFHFTSGKNPTVSIISTDDFSFNRCETCGEYIYRGTKLNARKEDVIGETYLNDVQIYRFYIKCTKCLSEITFKVNIKFVFYGNKWNVILSI